MKTKTIKPAKIYQIRFYCKGKKQGIEISGVVIENCTKIEHTKPLAEKTFEKLYGANNAECYKYEVVRTIEGAENTVIDKSEDELEP